MTKEEFQKLEKGQPIAIITGNGERAITVCSGEFIVAGNRKKMMLHSYGLFDERDIDVVRAQDITKMMDDETKRHEKRMQELNELLKEVEQ